MLQSTMGTYSILAHDPATKELGAASASCVLAVGGRVVHRRLGTGMVITQHADSPVFAQKILDRLSDRTSPEDALEAVLARDDDRQSRQIAVIDIEGRKAAWTGEQCADLKGHIFGGSCVVTGNTLARETVLPKMLSAFEEAREHSLGSRLLLALEAADSEGGDKRGRESASLLVIPFTVHGWQSQIIDIRVDQHVHPIAELRRLHGVLRERFSGNGGC